MLTARPIWKYIWAGPYQVAKKRNGSHHIGEYQTRNGDYSFCITLRFWVPTAWTFVGHVTSGKEEGFCQYSHQMLV
jgi:hypothetical protein